MQRGKKAQLEWKLCGQYSQGENNYALAEIELFTGRHHQIRVQMSHAGMPLLGDNKYGNEESGEAVTGTWRYAIQHCLPAG